MAVTSSSCPSLQPSAPPPPPWTELPRDITANILLRLGAVDILESAQKVCTTWWRVSLDHAMWRVLDMNKFGNILVEKISNLCRLAVKRSQGELLDLSLDGYADQELLSYIVQRSSKLKRLTMTLCNKITGECFVEAVKRLPNLEELHLIHIFVQAANVEVIGISCPMLKSFTLIHRGVKDRPAQFLPNDEPMEGQNNVYALAIAKTMPNLRHLCLFADTMNNAGLQAILDGCPHLESLDIQQCVNLYLKGDLGKRCSEQIKQLKLPSDSASDIDWPVGGCMYDSDDSSEYYGDAYHNDDYGDSFSDDEPMM